MRSMSSEAAARAKRGSMLTTSAVYRASPDRPMRLRKNDLCDVGETEVLKLAGRFFAADEIDFVSGAAVLEVHLQFRARLHLHVRGNHLPELAALRRALQHAGTGDAREFSFVGSEIRSVVFAEVGRIGAARIAEEGRVR